MFENFVMGRVCVLGFYAESDLIKQTDHSQFRPYKTLFNRKFIVIVSLKFERDKV